MNTHTEPGKSLCVPTHRAARGHLATSRRARTVAAMPPVSPPHVPYANEAEGQLDFFAQFRINPDDVLAYNTDGVHNGNLLEFKTNIPDVNSVLFQAVKYLSKLRVRGVDVPANILLVDLGKRTMYRFAAADYDDEIHKVYNTAASRENKGFQWRNPPEPVADYESPSGAQTVSGWLRDCGVHPIRITADCVVAWAERYYRDVKRSQGYPSEPTTLV